MVVAGIGNGVARGLRCTDRAKNRVIMNLTDWATGLLALARHSNLTSRAIGFLHTNTVDAHLCGLACVGNTGAALFVLALGTDRDCDALAVF